MRSQATKYRTLEDLNYERDAVPWYWRLIALVASWMILGGYLILPSTYDNDPQLRFSKGVLSIIIVALMTAGYSFTALLCFACRSWMFQAEAVFLPALASSSLGLLTVLYGFSSSTRYQWTSPAIVTVVLSAASCVIYGLLLLYTHRKISRVRAQTASRTTSALKDSALYNNFIQNMYPTAMRSPSEGPPPAGIPLSEDDLVNQQMAMLLMKSDPGPSPDASSSTFRIDLPEERESELLGTPRNPGEAYTIAAGGRNRSASNASPAPRQSMWERGRQLARGSPRIGGRPLSREERRVQIELGQL